MTDQELEKLLERRLEHFRRELEIERTDRRIERLKKQGYWMAGAGILLLMMVWSAVLVQCEVRSEIDRIRDVVKPSSK
jgi:hypothetical protein